MKISRLNEPKTDPTPIFEQFRGYLATELLTAAVSHLHVFDRLAEGPKPFDKLRREIGLEERPAMVLFTALRAMGLLESAAGRNAPLSLTELAQEHLISENEFDVSGYVGLAAESPGVLEMVARLKANHPPGGKPGEKGAAFIYREGMESAMEQQSSARHLTMSLAGRAWNVAPVMVERYPLPEARLLLDVGGGSGLYAIAYLRANPHLEAIVWDRPEVLKVAHEFAEKMGVGNRLECRSGDMFTDPVPHGADAILLSNVLHDWDVPECQTLVSRMAEALQPGRRLLIHDVFLNDELDGPLPIALYSAALFTLTEGRAYSAAEYRAWMTDAGLDPGPITPTLVHGGVLPGMKH